MNLSGGSLLICFAIFSHLVEMMLPLAHEMAAGHTLDGTFFAVRTDLLVSSYGYFYTIMDYTHSL